MMVVNGTSKCMSVYTVAWGKIYAITCPTYIELYLDNVNIVAERINRLSELK